ncbi:MAG: hypothetical protein JEZ10_09490 [Verrucomicrobia bacterium]|nr:hypothetical protein [Verrucomicrobiota bacterium]
MKKWINILLLVAVAVVSIWCTGDLMRKNDQAVIMAGSYDLAHGRAQDWGAYYQVDKTYVLYWTCAAIFKAQQFVRCCVDPVAAANMGLSLIFWSALTVFVVRFRRTLSPLALLCFLTAPAVLLNTLYVNSSLLSSAFLLLSAVFLFSEGRRGDWLAALFFALAVGSRADAILLLPLLLWLITPFPMVGTLFSNFSNGWKNPCLFPRGALKGSAVALRQWKLLLAGILALLGGRVLYGNETVSIDPFFNLKMVAGYVVFGFGAAGLLFVIYSIRLAVQTSKERGALKKMYGVAGLLAFLLPVLFFLPQLHAPRYFWRGCEAILLLAVSGRLSAGLNRRMVLPVCLAALLPLVIGVNVPSLTRPKIDVLHPTLFPSGDGHYPMGGTLPFLFRLRSATEHPIDHNQLVWNAVQKVEFHVDGGGVVPVLNTPMSGYLLLGASLQGKMARRASYEQLADSAFYSDSRSLMRDDPKTTIQFLSKILNQSTVFVSPVADGVGILRFGTGDDRWGKQVQLLNRLFAGNEYRVDSSDPNIQGGLMRVGFSESPFDGARMDARTGLYYSTGRGVSLGEAPHHAVSIFPSWMSLQSFRGLGE